MTMIRRRLSALEAKTGTRKDSAQIEADAKIFTDRIAELAKRCSQRERTNLKSFQKTILDSRDPFLLRAFRNAELGDWKL